MIGNYGDALHLQDIKVRYVDYQLLQILDWRQVQGKLDHGKGRVFPLVKSSRACWR